MADTLRDLAERKIHHHAREQRWSDGTSEQLCAFCGVEWPCDTAEVLAYAHQLEAQIERLANWIMANVPGEPSQSEGAVDTAIRLLAHK